MPDDITTTDVPQVVDEPGWRVIDADGNVVASGPGVVLEAVAEIAHTGEEQ